MYKSAHVYTYIIGNQPLVSLVLHNNYSSHTVKPFSKIQYQTFNVNMFLKGHCLVKQEHPKTAGSNPSPVCEISCLYANN